MASEASLLLCLELLHPCHSSSSHIQTSRLYYANEVSSSDHSCSREPSKFGFAYNLFQKILGVVLRGEFALVNFGNSM